MSTTPSELSANHDALNAGWNRIKVRNGAHWDICPSCVQRERKPETAIGLEHIHTLDQSGCCRICGEPMVPFAEMSKGCIHSEPDHDGRCLVCRAQLIP